MTVGGWINLLVSVGFVTVLFLWCIVRVLVAKPPAPDHQLAHVEPIESDQADER